MEKDRVAVEIYAKSAFDVAEKAFSFDRWQETLQSLADFVEDPEMRNILRDPLVTTADLEDFLAPMLDGAMADKDEKNFVLMLVRNGHLHLAPRIKTVFSEMVREHAGIADVHVASARKLDEEQLSRLRKHLMACFNIHADRMTSSVDDTLESGIVIRAGKRVIDQGIRKNRP